MRINERFEDLKAENQQLKDRIIRLEMKTEVLEEVLKELKAAMATKTKAKGEAAEGPGSGLSDAEAPNRGSSANDLPDEAGTEKKPARTSRAKKTT